MTRRPIYLDHHATTPVDARIADVVRDTFINAFGNANSVDHAYGDEAASLVRTARREVATLVGADPAGVFWTSGSTDAIRLAISHALESPGVRGRPLRIVASKVEHHAVLDALALAERSGQATVEWIPVDDSARLDWESLESACAGGADLICVMAANNEVGTIYPVQRIAELAHRFGARTLVDATQAAGWIDLDMQGWGVTYLALSAHKIYGPKGVGALVTSSQGRLRTARSDLGTLTGTPNVPGIVGLGEACRLRRLERRDDGGRVRRLRDHLQSLLLEAIPDLAVNGAIEHRLPNNLHVAVPGVPNDAVLVRLRNTVAISTGAACSSGALQPSHVLRAMRLPDTLQEGALRIGLGRNTTDAELHKAAEFIARAVHETRSLMASGGGRHDSF